MTLQRFQQLRLVIRNWSRTWQNDRQEKKQDRLTGRGERTERMTLQQFQQLGLVIILSLSTTTKADEGCDKCYHPVYMGDTREYVHRVHSSINSMCTNPKEVTMCKERGQIYWLAENKGLLESRINGACPTKELWMCTENDPRNPAGQDKQKGLNIIKEREVKGIFTNENNGPRVGWEKPVSGFS